MDFLLYGPILEKRLKISKSQAPPAMLDPGATRSVINRKIVEDLKKCGSYKETKDKRELSHKKAQTAVVTMLSELCV